MKKSALIQKLNRCLNNTGHKHGLLCRTKIQCTWRTYLTWASVITFCMCIITACFCVGIKISFAQNNDDKYLALYEYEHDELAYSMLNLFAVSRDKTITLIGAVKFYWRTNKPKFNDLNEEDQGKFLAAFLGKDWDHNDIRTFQTAINIKTDGDWRIGTWKAFVFYLRDNHGKRINIANTSYLILYLNQSSLINEDKERLKALETNQAADNNLPEATVLNVYKSVTSPIEPAVVKDVNGYVTENVEIKGQEENKEDKTDINAEIERRITKPPLVEEEAREDSYQKPDTETTVSSTPIAQPTGKETSNSLIFLLKNWKKNRLKIFLLAVFSLGLLYLALVSYNLINDWITKKRRSKFTKISRRKPNNLFNRNKDKGTKQTEVTKLLQDIAWIREKLEEIDSEYYWAPKIGSATSQLKRDIMYDVEKLVIERLENIIKQNMEDKVNDDLNRIRTTAQKAISISAQQDAKLMEAITKVEMSLEEMAKNMTEWLSKNMEDSALLAEILNRVDMVRKILQEQNPNSINRREVKDTNNIDIKEKQRSEKTERNIEEKNKEEKSKLAKWFKDAD